MWSIIGCAIAEMIIYEPLFYRRSATDQLVEIIKIFGTPTIDQIKQMNPQHQQFIFPYIRYSLSLNQNLIWLISLPLEALLNPYFDEIRLPSF
ncbi:unnamed protein product [Paramecium pentaurelia]|uniref:Uncharacterized protein n=1 Tax=Paramecium pentaurelia TaxID=43138 RepID=A0A8S1Y834_9CILI|nr:unnamed protein product [Paramecium pentaurelia]